MRVDERSQSNFFEMEVCPLCRAFSLRASRDHEVTPGHQLYTLDGLLLGRNPSAQKSGQNAAVKRLADKEVDNMSDSEFLTKEELTEVTGYTHVASQREWLEKNGWFYVLNAANRPIVGRWFARMRLAGVQPTAAGVVMQSASRPNFAALN